MKRVLIVSAALITLAACSSDRRLLTPDPEADRIVSPEKPATVKGRGVDPVCGAPMDKTTAYWHSSHEGKGYYFDSDACKRQFDENPDLYTGTVR